MAKISPIDIIHQEFKTAFRGYSQNEVDEFLSALAEDYGSILEENVKLKEQLEEAQRQLDQYRQSEELLKNALVNAEKAADDLRQNARKEAELIVKEGEQKVRELLEQAKQEQNRLSSEIESLKQKRNQFEAELRSALETHLRLLTSKPEKESETGDGGEQ